MKVLLTLTIFLLCLNPFVANVAKKKKKKGPKLSKYYCNKNLMDSYDIEGSWDVLKERNMICPLANKRNCCSYHAQLAIYKKWFMQGERQKILNLYKTYTQALDEIFQKFEAIEELTPTVLHNTRFLQFSNCKNFATAIDLIKASEMKNDVIIHAKKAFKFLYLSRKGFYCALCNQKNHKYFLLHKKRMTSNHGFCGSMVEHSLNYFVFKFIHFIKISRLYSEFTVKCSLKGKYYPNRPLKVGVKFYKKDKAIAQVISCKKMVKRKEAYKFCTPFCKNFNPTKYNKYLEGQMDKMFSLSKSLEDLIAKAHKQYEKDNKKDMQKIKRRMLGQIRPEEGLISEEEKSKLGFKRHQVAQLDKGRILMDIPPMPKPKFKKPIKPMEKEDLKKENEITSFNREFKMSLIRPITYDFNEDLSIEHHIDFDSSIMKHGLDGTYELTEWKMLIKDLGIDWYSEGKTAKVNKGTAKTVFRKINPNDEEVKDIYYAIMKNTKQ